MKGGRKFTYLYMSNFDTKNTKKILSVHEFKALFDNIFLRDLVHSFTCEDVRLPGYSSKKFPSAKFELR